MSELPYGFPSGSIHCFPIGPASDGNFGYLPGPPRIEILDGQVKANLFNHPAAPTLSLQLVWAAEDTTLAAAQAEIRRRHPELSDFRLSIAECASSQATLTLTGSPGEPRSIGPVETSGPEAYRAVFSTSLTAAETPAALAAFGGQLDTLSIHYHGSLELAETAKAQLVGDLAEQAKLLAPRQAEPPSTGFFGKKKAVEPPPPPPDMEACIAGVKRALANGELELKRTDTANVTDAARLATEQTLQQMAAKLLLATLTRMGPEAVCLSSLAVRFEASEPERRTYSIDGAADLGAWFAEHHGPQAIDPPP